MQKIHDIKLNGCTYHIKPLTVADAIAFYAAQLEKDKARDEQMKNEPDSALTPISPEDFVKMTFLSGINLELMLDTPGEHDVTKLNSEELSQLLALCRKVNPDFFAWAENWFPTGLRNRTESSP